MSDPWAAKRDVLGAYIRSQRKLANLSLRQLAELTSLSNPYLSQIERGLHHPSVRVLKLLSDALNVSTETLLAEAGLLDPDSSAGAGQAADPGSGLSLPDVEAAIRADQRLGDDQKAALITVYQNMIGRA
jgi:transcriptional regulator with XRE-family HTH domain